MVPRQKPQFPSAARLVKVCRGFRGPGPRSPVPLPRGLPLRVAGGSRQQRAMLPSLFPPSNCGDDGPSPDPRNPKKPQETHSRSNHSGDRPSRASCLDETWGSTLVAHGLALSVVRMLDHGRLRPSCHAHRPSCEFLVHQCRSEQKSRRDCDCNECAAAMRLAGRRLLHPVDSTSE